MNKKHCFLRLSSLLLIALFCLSGCSKKPVNNDGSTVTANSSDIRTGESSETNGLSSKENGSDISNSSADNTTNKAVSSSTQSVGNVTATITLKGSNTEIKGNGVQTEGNDIIITSAGTYAVSGALSNGRIVVNAGNAKVNVILNGADITSNYSSAFFVKKAGLVTLTALKGSVNLLADAENYSYTDGYSSSSDKTPDACVYSEKDLVINGEGKIIVTGNSQNGVTSKDSLKIETIDISVSAAGHGITGRDSLSITEAAFTVNAGRDGLRSNNTSGNSVGVVTLAEADGSIVSGEDGVQAENSLIIKSGSYGIISGGGSDGIPTSEISAKGLKGINSVTIEGGTISANSLDDTLHSNGNISVKGGSLVLKSGDDGIHADEDITLSGGTVAINKSYEGLEATNITVSGSNVKLTASDDGVNISGGDGSAEMGRPGMDHFGSSSGGTLLVSDGMLKVEAEGDGLDANGSIEISGGYVIVDGPTRGGNGVLDYDNSCNISGGMLIAVGSDDMAQTPSESSTQNSLVYTNFSTGSAGSLFNIQSADGTELITYCPSKNYNWICFSSPKIKTGESYTAYVGGSHSGTENDGIYTNGKYTTGTEIATLTVSSAVTSNGSTGGFGGMDDPHGGMGGGPRDEMGGGPRGEMGDPHGGFAW